MNLSNQWLDSSILFDKRLTSQCPSVNDLVSNYYQSLPVPNPHFKMARKKETLKMLLINLYLGHREDRPVAFSRNRNDYCISGRYGMLHFKYDLLIPYIDALRDRGLIHLRKGYVRRNGQVITKSRVSRMWASDSLKLLFTQLGNPSIQKHQYCIPIILKDGNKRLIYYWPEPLANGMEGQLNTYNSLTYRTPITHPLSTPTSVTKRNCNYSNGNMDLDCRLYRVFNNESWGQGGRFYGAEYQNESKQWRSGLVINGNPVRELDYSGMHVRMCYHLKGIDYQYDPYQIAGNPPQARDLFKKAFNIAINAISFSKASRALQDKINTDPHLKNIKAQSGLTTGQILQEFENAHPAISNYLHSGYGLKLQNKDSMIAADILMHFTGKEIVCLCVHDSFIVEQQHEDELKQIMTEVYRNHMGFDCPVK
jgi:hypothetical protein